MPRKDVRFNAKYVKNTANNRKDDKVQGGKIINETILSKHIADENITTTKLAEASVTSSKIANSAITDSKFSLDVQQRLDNGFIKKQIVHRRIIHGGTNYLATTMNASPCAYFSGGWYSFPGACDARRSLYGPYGYGVPSVQPGAERRTRIYAIWSDNIISRSDFPGYTPDKPTISIILNDDSFPNGTTYDYILGPTWGDVSTSRDGYSNEIVGSPAGLHATMSWHLNSTYSLYSRVALLLYAELQFLDVFP